MNLWQKWHLLGEITGLAITGPGPTHIAIPITPKQGFAPSRESSNAYPGKIQKADALLQCIELIGFTSAMRGLLAVDANDVEFGRQLYFAMRDLEQEGNSHCTLQSEAAEAPDFAHKTARLRCGTKTFVTDLQKFKNREESVQLNEALGAL